MVHYNKFKFNTIILINITVILLALLSCSSKIGNMMPVRPIRDVEFKGNVSPDFKKGWEDGCETGMSAGSNTFYKMFYRSNAVDGWKMTRSKDYQAAWNNSFWYCYRADYFKQKSSIWGSVFGGYR